MSRIFTVLLLLLAGTMSAMAGGMPDLSAVNDTGGKKFVSAQEAFGPHVSPNSNGWQVSFHIRDGYYLYQSHIHLAGPNSDQAKLTFIQTPELKDDKNFGWVKIYHHRLDVKVAAQTGETLKFVYQGCSEQHLCYPPQTLTLNPVTPASTAPITKAVSGNSAAGTIADATGLGHKNLFWVLLSFLGLGIGLSLTPCVFPMIPILSSIIVGQSSTALSARRGFSLALSYVVGMASAYAMIGALVAAFGARVNLSAFTQKPLVIGLTAVLFVVLAMSMFGLYELQLPAAIRNRLNDASNQQQGGKFVGTYLMGFFSALVVSPCVSAPLAGALIYLSTTGDVITGGSALFALGMGMGAPLLLIGLSGGRLLPKAGSWMLAIKAAFGVGLLGVAIALLSRIVPAQATLLMVGILAIGCAVYLGVLERPQTSRERLARSVGLVSMLCGILWIIGAAMGNGNLLHPLQLPRDMLTAGNSTQGENVTHVQTPAQLQQAIAKATANGKVPVVDIYADWCTSCREMSSMLESPDVQAALSRYQLVKFDITRGSDAQLKQLASWKVFGPPALQRFTLNGLPAGPALQGLPEASQLINWLTSS